MFPSIAHLQICMSGPQLPQTLHIEHENSERKYSLGKVAGEEEPRETGREDRPYAITGTLGISLRSQWKP